MTEQITMQSFTELCEKIWKQREVVDDISHKQKQESRKLEEMKSKVLKYLEHFGLEKQHLPGHGTLSIQNRFSVSIPQGDDKLLFFEALKKEGIFETLATVNSNTLNSWYKERMEQAIEQGDFDFKYPGIGEPKHGKTLGFRKG